MTLLLRLLQDYNLQWLLAVWLVMGVFCCSFLRPALGRVAATCTFYIMANGANTWLSSLSSYVNVGDYDQQAIRFFAADATSKLALVLVAAVWLAGHREKYQRLGERILVGYWLVDVCVVLWQAAVQTRLCAGENTCGSLVGNPSMNASFLVAAYPIVAKSMGGAMILPLLAVLVFSKASIPVGLAVVGVGLWGVLVMRKWWVGLVGLPMLWVGWSLQGLEFVNSGNRFEMWRFFLGKWNIPINWVFGTGYGTFGVFSTNLQRAFHMHEDGWWIWIHNDWLQVMFETGFVGLLLILATYVVAGSKLFLEGKREELVSFLLYGGMMTFNYPNHLAPTALFGAWLVCGALHSDAPNSYWNPRDVP